MNQRPIRTVEDMPGYFGLQIEYRDDLPANNAGYLDPHDEPQYIALNRNLPHCEQAFTIAHELGHYLRHHNQPRRRFFPGVLDREYQSERIADLACRTRRTLYLIFTKEWEADLYAFCLLFNIGAGDDLKAYLERHPEKMRMGIVAFAICFFKAIPRIIKGLILKFFKLFCLR
jgi:IrrE N-terminal-like domain